SLVDMEFLGQKLDGAAVTEMLEMGHPLEAMRNAALEWPFHVVVGDLIFGERRLMRCLDEARPGGAVEPAGRRQIGKALERRKRLRKVRAGFGVHQAEIGRAHV